MNRRLPLQVSAIAKKIVVYLSTCNNRATFFFKRLLCCFTINSQISQKKVKLHNKWHMHIFKRNQLNKFHHEIRTNLPTVYYKYQLLIYLHSKNNRNILSIWRWNICKWPLYLFEQVSTYVRYPGIQDTWNLTLINSLIITN